MGEPIHKLSKDLDSGKVLHSLAYPAAVVRKVIVPVLALRIILILKAISMSLQAGGTCRHH